MALTGTIHSEIGQLTNLGTHDTMLFVGKGLATELSHEIFLPFRLETLDFSANDLTGTIPTEIFQLSLLSKSFSCENYNRILAADDAHCHYSRYHINPDVFAATRNNLTGPFDCPDFVASCQLSCTNNSNPECRILE